MGMGNRRSALAFALLVCVALATALAFAGSSTAGPSHKLKSGPAEKACVDAGGTFAWNAIWGVDTSGYTAPVGYTCTFPGPALGGTTTESSLSNDPATDGLSRKCSQTYHGQFYLFSRVLGPGEEDTIYAGYGCQWLTS